MRNPKQIEYFADVPRLRILFRRSLIRICSGMLYESSQVHERVKKSYVAIAAKPFTILYTNFSISRDQPKKALSRSIRIGLLGTVSQLRRDYQDFILGLKGINDSLLKRLEIQILGATIDSESAYILKSISEICPVKAELGRWLSKEEFQRFGSQCDFLVAPLKRGEKSYGDGGSSGAFGDAIMLGKQLVIPAFSDPLEEFKDFCVYYLSTEDLTRSLTTQILASSSSNSSSAHFKNFTKEKVQENLNSLFKKSYERNF